LATGVFNLTNDELVIRSTDGGDQWDIVYSNSPFTPPVFFNALDVQANKVLVCGENGHILLSTDAGNSFTSVHYSAGLALLEVKFLDASRAIAIGDQAVLRSNNGGLSWAADPAFEGIGAYSIALSGTGEVYLSTLNGLLKSTNNGVTFNPVLLPSSGGIGYLAASHDTILGSGGMGFLISYNGGAYWQQFKAPPDELINKFELHNGKLYALCYNKTLMTLDLTTINTNPIANFSSSVEKACGESKLNANTLVDTNLLSLQWFLNGVFMGNEPAFQQTYDSLPLDQQLITLVVTDKNSFKTDTLIEPVSVGFLELPHADAGEDIYLCYGSVTYLKPVAAYYYFEWQRPELLDPQHPTYYEGYIRTKPFYEDTQIVLAAWVDQQCYTYDTLQVYVGAPLEESFNYAQTDIPDACNNASCVSVTNMEFVSDSVGFGMTNNGYLIKSIDEGLSWTATKVEGYNLTNSRSGLDFINEKIGYVGNPFRKTIDGGATFTEMSVPGDLGSFISADTGVVAHLGGSTFGFPKIYKTVDGGQTFTDIYGDLTNYGFVPLDMQMLSANNIFTVGRQGNNGFGIQLSTNGGLSWENIPVPPGLGWEASIQALSLDTIFITSGHVYRTYDRGLHWHTYFLEHVTPVFWDGAIHMLNVDTGYLSVDREIYKTTNGGDCWTKIFTADWRSGEVYSGASIKTICSSPSRKSLYFAASGEWTKESPAIFHQRYYRVTKGALQARACVGTPIFTHNQSFGYTHYQWYVDGIPYSNTYDTELSFNTPGDYSIKLVMDSLGLYPDSLTFNLQLLPPPGHLNAIEGPKSVCTIQFDPNIPPIFPAIFTISEHAQFPQLVWGIEANPNLAYEEIPSDSGANYRINFFFNSHESTSVFVFGIDSLGCHSDTVSKEIRTLNAVPSDPTFFNITQCLVLDSSNVINGIALDSVECSWGEAEEVDHYALSFPSWQVYETSLSTKIPLYSLCAGQYGITLTNDNACGASNPIEGFYGVQYADLTVNHSPDTSIAPFTPVELNAEVLFDPLFQDLGCPPIPVEWHFNGIFYGTATTISFPSVTPSDTGTYLVRFFNGCDSLSIPIHLGFKWGVSTHVTYPNGVLNIAPNPSSGNFAVELAEAPTSEETYIQIVGLTGQVLHQMPLLPGNTIQSVQASELPAGLYFLQIVSMG
ncbi:MAG: T9SS type A sorting domain-containing protein, partial [Sediminibacterium sp.]